MSRDILEAWLDGETNIDGKFVSERSALGYQEAFKMALALGVDDEAMILSSIVLVDLTAEVADKWQIPFEDAMKLALRGYNKERWLRNKIRRTKWRIRIGRTAALCRRLITRTPK